MNRFRDPMMRGLYDEYAAHFTNREFLFDKNGGASLNNSFRYSFWNGFYKWREYNGADRSTTGYAIYRAGVDARIKLFGKNA